MLDCVVTFGIGGEGRSTGTCRYYVEKARSPDLTKFGELDQSFQTGCCLYHTSDSLRISEASFRLDIFARRTPSKTNLVESYYRLCSHRLNLLQSKPIIRFPPHPIQGTGYTACSLPFVRLLNNSECVTTLRSYAKKQYVLRSL